MNDTQPTAMDDEAFRETIEDHLKAYSHETVLPLATFDIELLDAETDNTAYTEDELESMDATIARIKTTFDGELFGFEIVNTTAEDIGLNNAIMRAVDHLEEVLYEEHLAEKFA